MRLSGSAKLKKPFLKEQIVKELIATPPATPAKNLNGTAMYFLPKRLS